MGTINEHANGGAPPTGGRAPAVPLQGSPAASASYFRQIFEKLRAPLYTTDADGWLTGYNAAAAALWGREPKIGEDRWCGSWQLFRSDGTAMPHDECPAAVALRTGEQVEANEAVAQRPDGSRYSFAVQPTLLHDDAGNAIGAVNLLIDLTDRDAADVAAYRLAAIVESSEDAIISKTLEGVITSWNAGAERLFGYRPEEIVGKSILTLIPPDRHAEEDKIIGRIRRGDRLEHFETVRQRKDGSLFDISLTVSPIKRPDGSIVGASKIGRDITERKKSELMLKQHAERLETLNRVATIISRDLDMDRIVQVVTDLATELSGAKFGAFFYNITSEDGEAYQLYSLSGAPREAFDSFGMPRNTPVFAPTFAGEGIIRSDDIRKDPRYGKCSPHYGMPAGHLPVVSYLAVPVVSASGEVLGGLFFAHDEPGQFTVNTETLVSAIAAQTAVAMDNARLHKEAQIEIEQRRRAEEAKELLLHEIKHRVKNTLATIQAMAFQTFREAPREEVNAFIARLHALSGAHDLLTQRDWDAVDVGNLVERALRPFASADEHRILASGSEASLPSDKALMLAMLLHELSTNAVKYGSLSNDTGVVEVTWTLREQPHRRLELVWRERGGPVVSEPTRKGFGSRMMERALRGDEGRTTFEFLPAGLQCKLELAL